MGEIRAGIIDHDFDALAGVSQVPGCLGPVYVKNIEPVVDRLWGGSRADGHLAGLGLERRDARSSLREIVSDRQAPGAKIRDGRPVAGVAHLPDGSHTGQGRQLAHIRCLHATEVGLRAVRQNVVLHQEIRHIWTEIGPRPRMDDDVEDCTGRGRSNIRLQP